MGTPSLPVPGLHGTFPIGGHPITTQPSAPGSTGPGGPETHTGGGAPPGAGDTPIAPELETYREEAYAANLGEVAFEKKAGAEILGLKVEEQAAESTIVAGAAARGLKLSGSPLYQLTTQKQKGASAIGLATSQESLADTALFESNQAKWNQALLNVYHDNQAANNMWLSLFESTISFATSFLGLPSFSVPQQQQQQQTDPFAGWTGGPLWESGIDYYDY